jgi:subtilisin-like proprotein convertase family protein
VSNQDWVDPNSADAFAFETNFNLDLNSDGTIGNAYSTVHTVGSVAFQKSSGSGLYAVSVNGGSPLAITNGGTQIYEGIYGGWQTLAAATINGVNTVLWKNTSANRLHTWSLDSNWNHVSNQDWVDPNSADAIAFETNFNLDLNSDGTIGSAYSTVHAVDSVAFQKSSGSGLYAVSVNGGSPIAITNGGTQIYEGIYAGWQTLAAATINGVNTVLWKNTSANRLHTWSLDSNWNYVSNQDWVDPNSADAFAFETNFNLDLNSDGTIGNPLSLTDPSLEPRYSDQWHLHDSSSGGANVVTAWSLTNNSGNNIYGTGIHINIIDDGIEKSHADLSTNYISESSYDYVGGDSDPTPPPSSSHGTSCAGVAAGYGHNGVGITGAAPNANLSGQRLLGAGTATNEATALTRTLNAVDIYSNSWGPTDNGTLQPAPPQVLAALANGTTNGRNGKGAIYTWAGGNGRTSKDNSNYDGYANSRYVISVAATSNLGTFSSYSEPGANIMVSSPSNGGTDAITTTSTNNAYTDNFSGTSAATPLVSGTIALMLEANPNLSWRDVQHVLVNSSDVVDSSSSGWFTNGAGHEFSHDYGFGRINAGSAVTLSKTWSNVGSEVSHSASINPGTSIPDAGGGSINSQINITQDITIESVEIPIQSDHTYAGDLTITLRSPAGTTAILSEGNRRDTNTLNFTFSAKTFWGETSQGNWTLTIEDLARDDTGTLNSWGLNVYGTRGSNYRTNTTNQITDLETKPFQGSSGLTYASKEALQEIEGLSSYLSHIEEILDQSPDKATGDWVIGTQGLKGRVIRESNLGNPIKIAAESTQVNKKNFGATLRTFAVDSELESESFIAQSLDSLNDKMIYAYPEMLHDTTTRSLIPSFESNL